MDVRSKKNEFGSNWWAKKWNATLNRLGYNNRLQKGKVYAREGNVREIHVFTGKIEAEVVGNGPTPYKIIIKVKTFSTEQWEEVIAVMSKKAIFCAKLLASEMPENIEEAFETAKISLLPKRANDLETECSCPDYINPCKHIAAVYYMLGLEFDKDPFMIFKLRGMEKEAVLEALRKARSADNGLQIKKEKKKKEVKTILDLQKELENFKGLSSKVTNMEFSYSPPKVSFSVIKRLGAPGFYKMPFIFQQKIEPFYVGAAEKIQKYVEE